MLHLRGQCRDTARTTRLAWCAHVHVEEIELHVDKRKTSHAHLVRDIVAVRSLGRGVLPDGWVEAATTSYEEMRDKTQVQLAEMQCYSL